MGESVVCANPTKPKVEPKPQVAPAEAPPAPVRQPFPDEPLRIPRPDEDPGKAPGVCPIRREGSSLADYSLPPIVVGATE